MKRHSIPKSGTCSNEKEASSQPAPIMPVLKLVSQDEDKKESSVTPMSLASPPSHSKCFFIKNPTPRNIRKEAGSLRSQKEEEADRGFQEKLMHIAEKEEEDVGKKTGEALLDLFNMHYRATGFNFDAAFDKAWRQGVYSWLLWVAKARGHASENMIDQVIEFMWRRVNWDVIVILFEWIHSVDPTDRYVKKIGPSDAYCSRKANEVLVKIQKQVAHIRCGHSCQLVRCEAGSEEAVRKFRHYLDEQSKVIATLYAFAHRSVKLIRARRDWVDDEGVALSPESHLHLRGTVDDREKELKAAFEELSSERSVFHSFLWP
jgi:hypothetical protein